MAQLVARTAGGREVAGSSPVTPTKNNSVILENARLLGGHPLWREESPGNTGQDSC